jgi:hypothetical protein
MRQVHGVADGCFNAHLAGGRLAKARYEPSVDDGQNLLGNLKVHGGIYGLLIHGIIRSDEE